ncbi:MAG: long-chain-fatty-acid--CoA ligase [Proteobacteria bacterium]|nr:long-chain-fatty-acid--CoA ligase [Pseudomonadota bacterium]
MDTQLLLSSQLVIGEVLARWARKTPDREALVCRERRFTYRQYNERVNRLANGLQSLGVDKGDKVALLFTNSNEIAECFLAVCKLGAVVVPLNFRLIGRELVYQIRNSDSKVLIFGEQFQEMVNSIRDRLPEVKSYICAGHRNVAGTRNYEEFLGLHDTSEPMVPMFDDDPAFIMYTSGTTGQPKGAVLTHKNLILSALITSIEAPGSPAERMLCITPLFHVAAAGSLIKMLLLGGTTVVHDQFDPRRVLETIEKEKITYMFLVPAMWIMLLENEKIDGIDKSSLQRGLTGASVMPASIKKKVSEHFPKARLSDSFGQTEMSPVTAILRPEDFFRKQGSVGRPVMTIEARVVDESDNDVPQGQVGEIIYRGPTTMKEYYKNPEATAEAMRNGWFHSGDLVRIDEEGFIYVVDRSKDMIVSGGENIYAVEVEEVLYTHPSVLEAAVIGVPDPKWEEAVKAVVVLREGYQATEEEIIEHCRQNLAGYKKPKSVEFLEELPKNATGKVQKFILREKYQ